jgi:hypothetical protein
LTCPDYMMNALITLRRHPVLALAVAGEESVSLYAERAFRYGTYGQTRPGRMAVSTAVPSVC